MSDTETALPVQLATTRVLLMLVVCCTLAFVATSIFGGAA